MNKFMARLNVYIDGNNLHRSAKGLGYEIDYKRLVLWLRQKFRADKIFLFIGLVPDRVKFYEYLQSVGLVLVFKQTVTVGKR